MANKTNVNEPEPCWPCEEQVIEKLPPCPLQCRSEKCKSFKKASFEGKTIVWVIGGPGSGRSTQSQKISAKYGFTLMSIDALLQAEVNSQSVRGKCLSKALERGELAPDDLILDLLKNAIFSSLSAAKGFVIDGYPREKKQGVGFEKKIAPCTIILYLEASTDTLMKRLQSRAASDEQFIKHRLKMFHEKNELLLSEFLDKIQSINADRSPDEIFSDVCRVLDPIIAENTANVAKP